MKIKLLFLLCISAMIGRTQITFPAPGAKWHYAKYSFGGPQIYNEQVVYSRDTVVLGRPCKILDGLRYFSYCGWMGRSYVYSSNDSVYFYNVYTMNQWQVLYNFNAGSGQGWTIYQQDIFGNNDIDTIDVVVDSVKTTIINTFPLKTLFVTYHERLDYGGAGFSYDSHYQSEIYDRIGDISYLLDYVQDFLGICDDGNERFLCYEDSLIGIYQKDTFSCNYSNNAIQELAKETIKIYPNPTSDKIYVELNGQGVEFHVSDLIGNKIANAKGSMDTGNLPNGIYFVRVKTAEGLLTRKIIVQH